MTNSPNTQGWKLQWIEGMQMLICFNLAIAFAMAPIGIGQMIVEATAPGPSLRAFLIVLAVLYFFTLAPLVMARLIAWAGFAVQRHADRVESGNTIPNQ